MQIINGIIIKALSGFYYVEAADKIYECKARGVFRKNGQAPYVGDYVTIQISEDNTGTVTKIMPRKNSFLRPSIANIDNFFIVCSTVFPSPVTLNIDKVMVLAEKQGITPTLIVSKIDLDSGEKLIDIYKSAGIEVIPVCIGSKQNIDLIRDRLKGKKSVFTGNSGVGKSTLLNSLFKELDIQTAPISKKLGRGKHTTRHVEFYKIDSDSYVADTPGFSEIDINKYGIITNKQELAWCFPEFRQYIDGCKFSSCSHICEKGCMLLKALAEGKITKSRFNSYVSIYKELEDMTKTKKIR